MGTHFLKSKVIGTSQELERKQVREVHSQTEESIRRDNLRHRKVTQSGERHSQTRECKGRDNLEHRKKASEQGSLTF
jgi:hypothetical protein